MNTPCEEERHTQSVRMCANCSFSRSLISISYRFRVTFSLFDIFFFLQCDFSTKFFPSSIQCVYDGFVLTSRLSHRYTTERANEEEEEEEIWCRSVNWGGPLNVHTFFFLARSIQRVRKRMCVSTRARWVCKSIFAYVFVHSFYCLVGLRLEQRKKNCSTIRTSSMTVSMRQEEQNFVGVVIRPICRWFNIKWSMDD